MLCPFIYFSSQTSVEQPCMIIYPTKIHRCPENSIFSPLFSASHKNAGFQLFAKADSDFFGPSTYSEGNVNKAAA